MGLRLLSWNVEHFRDGSKLDPVAELIQSWDPDVFALYEVENLNVLELMRDHFPTFTFNLTDGPESQEILVGYRTSNNYQATFTQKREFKAYNPSLRPGALLTLRKQDNYLNFLFLHTDSGTDAPAFGNRAEMFDKVWKMKEAIDKLAGAKGHLVVTGDFNTMGLFFPSKKKSDESVAASKEVQALGDTAAKSSMGLLVKEFDSTWTNGKIQSNLDHILASSDLKFKNLGNRSTDAVAYQVAVRGWHQLAGAKRTQFISNVSDHCSLQCEVSF